MKRLLLVLMFMAFGMAGCVYGSGPAGDTSQATETRESIVETTAAGTTEGTEPVETPPIETVVPETTEEAVDVEIVPGGGVWDESDYQLSAAIIPQPGDTAERWNPQRAEFYPEDAACTDAELLEKWMTAEGVTFAELDALGCGQLILVVAQETDGVETVTVCYEKQSDGSWTSVGNLSWMNGWAGGNGIMHGRLRNTNTTPAGLWSLGLAFGNEEKPEGLKMPWRDVTENADWVCDENSIYFNTWQERGTPGLEDWSDDVEHLADYQKQYAYACVIRFNTAPYTVTERGCAIFLHCATGATGGCVGLLREDMIRTLLWLDPEKMPYILVTGYQLYENVDTIIG